MIIAALVAVVALAFYCRWRGLTPKPTSSAAATGMVVGLCLGGAFSSRDWGIDELTGMVFGLLIGSAIDHYRKRAARPIA